MPDGHHDNATGPFPETADIETSSDNYAGRFAGPTGTWFLETQARITLAMLDLPPGSAVLDVGGGHGQLAEPLCRAGYPVTVLGSAESCRTRIATLVDSGSCTFRVGNVIALPFADRSFPVVTCFRLLPHCERWPQLVAELCRVATQCVIVDYPAVTGLNALAPALFGAKQRVEKNTRAWRQFTHAEVRQAFADNGFDRAQRTGQFMLPMALHRALRCRRLSVALEGPWRLLGLTQRFGSPVIAKLARR